MSTVLTRFSMSCISKDILSKGSRWFKGICVNISYVDQINSRGSQVN